MSTTKNNESTRFYSNKQEEAVCKALGGRQQSNSGAGHFSKGDIIVSEASMLIECKTVMKAKESVSIKKSWFEKNNTEAFSTRCTNSAVAFNFGPDQSNYYIISERLMKYLIECLKKDEANS